MDMQHFILIAFAAACSTAASVPGDKTDLEKSIPLENSAVLPRNRREAPEGTKLYGDTKLNLFWNKQDSPSNGQGQKLYGDTKLNLFWNNNNNGDNTGVKPPDTDLGRMKMQRRRKRDFGIRNYIDSVNERFSRMIREYDNTNTPPAAEDGGTERSRATEKTGTFLTPLRKWFEAYWKWVASFFVEKKA